ncbi:MAG: class I SAM-dependent methyltransferase [Flavobacteriaceae bacterium]|nr:class I SAM-dependent methyltransferase [Flavobacteriaceae bacterium]
MNKITCFDHLVTGDSFVLEPHDHYDILQTTPQPKDIEKYYDHPNYISHKKQGRSLLFSVYSRLRQWNHNYKIKIINKHTQIKGKLLDFGAGTGSFVEFANTKGWQSEGFEPNTKPHGAKVKYQRTWTNQNTYQAITAWHVVEHLPNPNEFFKHALNSLTDNGKLFVALPNFTSWDANKYGAMWAAYDVPRHLWHFSPEGFISMAKDLGFETEKTYPLRFDAYYVSLLSEQNRKSNFPWFKAFWSGWRSNRAAKHSKNYSSLIYVLQKRK